MIYLARCSECYSGFPDGHECYEPDKIILSGSFFCEQHSIGGLIMDLLKDNLKKLYFKFLIPSLGSAMVMSIYTLTDAIVIGKGVGADALAALSITTPLLCILMSTGILFGVGGSVQMSVHRGSGNHQKSNRYFTISFFLITAVTALLWLIYATCMPKLLHLMGANDTLFPYAMSYMRYINIFHSLKLLFANHILSLLVQS